MDTYAIIGELYVNFYVATKKNGLYEKEIQNLKQRIQDLEKSNS